MAIIGNIPYFQTNPYVFCFFLWHLVTFWFKALNQKIVNQIITKVFTKMVVRDISRSQHNMSDCDGIPDSSEQMCVCVSGFKAVCVSGLSQSFSDLTSPLKFEVFLCSTFFHCKFFFGQPDVARNPWIGHRYAQKFSRILQRLFAPGWLLRLECQLPSWEGTGYVLI